MRYRASFGASLSVHEAYVVFHGWMNLRNSLVSRLFPSSEVDTDSINWNSLVHEVKWMKPVYIYMYMRAWANKITAQADGIYVGTSARYAYVRALSLCLVSRACQE